MKPEKIKEIRTALQALETAHNDLQSSLQSGPGSFYFEKLLGYYEGCMAASKFKVGDRVTLNNPPDFDKSPGWAGYKSVLKAENVGTISEVDYGDGLYTYGVEFVEEKFDRVKGTSLAKGDTHLFFLNESDLTKHSSRISVVATLDQLAAAGLILNYDITANTDGSYSAEVQFTR